MHKGKSGSRNVVTPRGSVVAAIVVSSALLAFAVVSASAGAGQTAIGQWRLFSVMPSTSQYWAVDKAVADGSGGVIFPFAPFESPSTGSFATYLTHNYNVDLTGATITATASWKPGTYVTRGYPGDSGAYARIEFQDVSSGGYTSSDYWWYSGDKFDLNDSSQAASKTVVAELSDRAHWSNICGQSADDMTVYPSHTNCVLTTDPTGSPYDGFTNAMKNVKEVNLAFGRTSRYSSGVAALDTATATFDLTDFQVTR